MLLLIGAVLGAVGTVLATRDCSFSQATWNAGRQAPANHDVLEHDVGLLVRCSTLDGLSRSQVRRLLGPADQDRKGDWSYDIGVPDTLSDYPDFHVRFDRSGHVRDATVPGYVESDMFTFFFGAPGVRR